MQIDVGFTTENKYEIAFEFGSKFHWVCYIVNYNMGGFKKVVVCNSLKNPWFLVVIKLPCVFYSCFVTESM